MLNIMIRLKSRLQYNPRTDCLLEAAAAAPRRVTAPRILTPRQRPQYVILLCGPQIAPAGGLAFSICLYSLYNVQ